MGLNFNNFILLLNSQLGLAHRNRLYRRGTVNVPPRGHWNWRHVTLWVGKVNKFGAVSRNRNCVLFWLIFYICEISAYQMISHAQTINHFHGTNCCTSNNSQPAKHKILNCWTDRNRMWGALRKDHSQCGGDVRRIYDACRRSRCNNKNHAAIMMIPLVPRRRMFWASHAKCFTVGWNLGRHHRFD